MGKKVLRLNWIQIQTPLELDIPKIMFWYLQELFLKDFYPVN